MKITIKNKIDTPIYEQICEQIKSAVIEDKAKEGEQLPSIRQLAKDLKISVITTTKAYALLEEEGFITAVKGKGYYVAPKNNQLMRERFIASAEESLEKAVHDGRAAGLSDEEIIELLKIQLGDDII